MTRSFLILFSTLILIGVNCSPPVEKLDPGIIIKSSSNTIDSTYNTLKKLISSNPNLTIIAELDHQDNAASVDLTLSPTRIILFGNPKLGTPLMQESQVTGIDLPQKILVFQEPTGEVKIAYNDPEYLKSRHGLTKQDKILSTMSTALDKLTESASK